MRGLISGLILLGLWQGLIWLTAIPPYLLPPPLLVLQTLWAHGAAIFSHSLTTLAEIGLGLILALTGGFGAGLLLYFSAPLRRWLLPLILISQAVPTFALGPIIMLWFGYGLASKVLITALAIFFPITVATYDGLRAVPGAYRDLARSLGARPGPCFFRVMLPAALPSIASGLRIGLTIAPIGALVGEWVGGSAGLGYLMLHSLARVDTALMFAALLVMALLTLALYYGGDFLLRKYINW